MQASPLLSVSSNSPSFDSYSSVNLAEIAARVVDEFRLQEPDPDEWLQTEPHDTAEDQNDVVEDGECVGAAGEFEFSMVRGESDFDSLVAADEIFHNGQIRPIYPYSLFNSDFLYSGGGSEGNNEVDSVAKEPKTTPSQRSPLRKLMKEESEATASCSSSEADDDLDGVPPESYCVWKPRRDNDGGDRESSPSCRNIKSHSTGSSKRWRLRDLLYVRSNSDGKEAFVFLSLSKRNDKSVNKTTEEKHSAKESSPAEDRGSFNLYSRNNSAKSAKKEGEKPKRRSYLPYRQDLVGIFSNVNGLSRNLHPF